MKIVTTLILCVFLSIGCANKPASSNDSVDSNIITAKSGDIFNITLESNPTTGYSWSIEEPFPEILQKVSNEYKPYNTSGNIVGSGGTEIWTFKGIAKGNTTLTFQYSRPWEKDVPPIKKELYNISVK
jgi:inhibitor of cysteine peptidase